MSSRAQTCVLLALLCCARLGVSLAQPTGEVNPQQGRPELPGVQRPVDSVPPKPVPALPGSKTRADTFRELLAMTPVERARALADRTEEQRMYLETRLREYEALSAAEREARLQQLDLTWHLDALMRLAPDRRAERLAHVSPALRPLIDERLREWDLLPARVQASVLEHETTANYFLRVRPTSPAPGLPPEPLAAPALLPQDKPGRALTHLTEFLKLSPKEQQKTLNVLPPGEREEMGRALRVFASLPAEQRRVCIASFEKFSRMTKPQRDRFLENAERWKAMSPRERETWRSLVSILPSTALVSEQPTLPGNPQNGGRPVPATNRPGQR